MTTVRGDDFANVIYQDDYGHELDIYAYGGNDRIYLNITGTYGGFNWVDAGSGQDQVYNVFEGGNDIDLGSGDDYYVGSGYSTDPDYYDVVYGYDGNDIFEISTFHSDYYGEVGNDVFYSVGFNNLFHGGVGVDVVSYELQDTDEDLAGRGVVVDLAGEYSRTRGTNYEEILISIENVVGSGAADDIYGSAIANRLWGSNGNDYIAGRAGEDTLFGEGGNDTLDGGAGNDIVYGEAGNDTLHGSTGGLDRLDGGAGSDTYVLGGQNAIIVDSSGVDLITCSISRSIGSLSFIENLALTGTAAINGVGNGNNNALAGNSAANSLNGSAGNDSLNGGLGNDTLIGGTGTDTFLFNTALNASTNVDMIGDFAVVDDTIRLDNAIFTALTATGTLSASLFTANAAGIAQDADDRIIYDSDSGRLYYDSNGNAAGGSVHFATVAVSLTLTANDFYVA